MYVIFDTKTKSVISPSKIVQSNCYKRYAKNPDTVKRKHGKF